MSLPTTNLDDRKFQDIVDQAKRLIPQYCPEWTDHNVSDPGVALIELFAWMTDMLLYRVNQVPDKMYVKFLEMIGVKLEPPQAATVPITFYLSQAQPVPLILPEASEVATVRTETNPAIIFSTELALTITPPVLLGAFSRDATLGRDAPWVVHELSQLDLDGNIIWSTGFAMNFPGFPEFVNTPVLLNNITYPHKFFFFCLFTCTGFII